MKADRIYLFKPAKNSIRKKELGEYLEKGGWRHTLSLLRGLYKRFIFRIPGTWQEEEATGKHQERPTNHDKRPHLQRKWRESAEGGKVRRDMSLKVKSHASKRGYRPERERMRTVKQTSICENRTEPSILRRRGEDIDVKRKKKGGSGKTTPP